MTYRTKTYIAGDWTGDENLINQLYKWNRSEYWGLHFIDAHELTNSRDSSKPCSIKRSLSTRLDSSKTFVLVVGSKTLGLTKGSCRWCYSYDSYHSRCHAGGNVDYRSFVDYECEKAKRDNLKIVVLYNFANIYKDKCPESVRYTGQHLAAYYYSNGQAYWNYSAIKNAIME